MSDDIGKKVQQIAQMLGQENMPDNVKELVTLLASSLGSKEENANKAASSTSDVEDKTKRQEPEADISLSDTNSLGTADTSLERLNTGNDPRINLLQAIKPFMNSKRQKKIGTCIQLFQVASISRLFSESEK